MFNYIPKAYFITIIVLVCAGLGISIFILPRDDEIAFMELQDQSFEEAFEKYKKMYEKDGQQTLNVVIPLTQLYIHYGAIDTAVKIMEKFAKKHPNDPAILKKLANYYQQNQQLDQYLATLEIIAHNEPTPSLLRELLDFYHIYNLPDKQIDVLRKIVTQPSTYSPSWQDHINLAFLYAATNQKTHAIKILEVLLKKTPQAQNETLTRFLFSLLIDINHTEEAIKLAQNIIKNNNLMHGYELLRILKHHHRLDIIPAIFSPFIKNIYRFPELSTELITIYTTATQRPLLPIYETQLRTLLDDSLTHKTISKSEIVNIAYMLIEHKLPDIAEKTLLSLAEKSPPQSPEVAALLYLWEGHTSKHEERWLRTRASHAKHQKEQNQWLQHLYNNGHARTVITIVEQKTKSVTDDTLYIYIQALFSTHEHIKLAKTLKHYISSSAKGKNSAQLHNLTNMALSIGANDMAIEILNHMREKTPHDRQTLKNLSKLYFFQAQYTKAKTLLQTYFHHYPGDTETYYYYAEILWQQGKYAQANIYHQKALRIIKTLAMKDKTMQAIHAHLMLRLNAPKKAATLYETLLQDYPDDLYLRSDYASALMQMGQYKKAKKILGIP